jgi:hypothetical protein
MTQTFDCVHAIPDCSKKSFIGADEAQRRTEAWIASRDDNKASVTKLAAERTSEHFMGRANLFQRHIDPTCAMTLPLSSTPEMALSLAVLTSA